ncbi:MAG: glycosyltransferase family 4 protein, partial [Acidimicrobiia bacterium]
LPTFAGGDAITAHVLSLRRVLRAAGYESEIFADDVRPEGRPHARHYSKFKPSPGEAPAWLLYHLSIGSPLADFVMEQARTQPLAVYYHNITPARYFERWNPEAAERVRAGRAQMRKLASHSRFALAASTYNAAELEAEGYPHAAVAPIVINFSEYGAPPDGVTLARLRRQAETGGARWLFVGRIAPHKCQHDVIGAFAVYRALFDPAARLYLVGGKASELYFRALEMLVAELGIADAVDFAGLVTPPELLAYYRSAEVFVSLSEHEGFCVPLLEAMHFGIPVVARGVAAVPVTVGDAGLLLPGNDPVLAATAVDAVLSDDSLRECLVSAGHQRVSTYALERTAARVLDLFGSRGTEVA